MKYLVLPLFFTTILSGCATPQPPGIQIQTQTVNVPTPVYCKISIPVQPEFQFDILLKSDTIYRKTQVLLSDRLLSLGYQNELLTALKGCEE